MESWLSVLSLYHIVPLCQVSFPFCVIFYETCRLGTACKARYPQMASPQKGSCGSQRRGSVASPVWFEAYTWLRKPTFCRLLRHSPSEYASIFVRLIARTNHSPPARSLRRTQCTNLWVVYNCALSKLRGFLLLPFQQFFQQFLRILSMKNEFQ